jgi:hypothetical protein
MSKLVVNPGLPGTWEIHLKPGPNSFGRADANDFKISDPSVSGSHCQIVVGEQHVLLTDFGSTNGTFVAGAPVRERTLEHGQVVRLGNVEMIYYSDAHAPAAQIAPVATVLPVAPVAAVAPLAVAMPTLPPPPPPLAASGAAKPGRLSVASLSKSHSDAPPAAAAAAAAAAPAQDITESTLPVVSGTRYCKYHPKTSARHYCGKCDKTYCDMCIHMGEVHGVMMRACRACGGELARFDFRPPVQKTFAQKLPAAFAYPFQGAGIVIVICATIAFAAMSFVSGGITGVFMRVALYGFIFLFMQNIILTTTSDEKDGLSFPEPGGFFGAAGQLVGTVLASFWLTIGLIIARYEEVDIPTEAIIASLILGAVYFPMALLAVAMKDTVLAANPLIVIPAMLKVPGRYAITVGLTLLVMGVRQLGTFISGGAAAVSLTTRHVNTFMMAAGVQMILGLVSVYLLVVTMRILGLFYNSSKQKLGWYHN